MTVQSNERKTAGKARKTAKWAGIMTKWLISNTDSSTAWQLVEFTGPRGGESRGVVDLIAIRKNHRYSKGSLNKGDLFDIILLQIKGGGAKIPTSLAIERLRKVARHHRAIAIVYAHWKKGRQPDIYRLHGARWLPAVAREVFG